MAACILLAALLLFVPYLSDDQWHKQVHPILIIEFIATEAFGIAWFVKGKTLDMLTAVMQRSVGMLTAAIQRRPLSLW